MRIGIKRVDIIIFMRINKRPKTISFRGKVLLNSFPFRAKQKSAKATSVNVVHNLDQKFGVKLATIWILFCYLPYTFDEEKEDWRGFFFHVWF